MRSTIRRVGAVFASLIACAAWADFRVSLEEPVDAGTASGVANVRGWAVSDASIDRVELFVDGQYVFEIPYGGLREDVEQVFPAIAGSRFSGFGQTYNYGSLGAGEHTMMIRVHDGSGAIREDTARFVVVGFPDSFLSANESPDLSDSDAELDRATGVISIDDVRQGGREYDLQLVWSTAAQAFVMQSLSPSQDDDGEDEVPSTGDLGERDPALVGRWSGSIDGAFGSGSISVTLESTGTVSGIESSVFVFTQCPLQTPQWGVRDSVFRLSGTDCEGTEVTFEAPSSSERLAGTWIGRPSGNRGTFDIRPAD